MLHELDTAYCRIVSLPKFPARRFWTSCILLFQKFMSLLRLFLLLSLKNQEPSVYPRGYSKSNYKLFIDLSRYHPWRIYLLDGKNSPESYANQSRRKTILESGFGGLNISAELFMQGAVIHLGVGKRLNYKRTARVTVQPKI